METGFSKYEREMLSSRLPIAATMKYLDLIKSTQKLDFSDHPEVMAERAAKKADSKIDPNIKIEPVDDWKIENLTPQQLKKRLKNRMKLVPHPILMRVQCKNSCATHGPAMCANYEM